MSDIQNVTLDYTVEQQMNKINELLLPVNAQIIADILNTLTTTTKTSLAAAINELVTTKFAKAGGTITGDTLVEAGLTVQNYIRVGKDLGGDSIIELFDDANNVWRALFWDTSVGLWKVEDSSGDNQELFHGGRVIDLDGTATVVQQVRGTTAQSNAYLGPSGQIVADTDKKTLVMHDGIQLGGFPMARESDVAGQISKVKVSALDTSSSYLENKLAASGGVRFSKIGTGGAEQLLVKSGVDVGDIKTFVAYGALPAGWMLCNGAAISRANYTELFNLIGTSYGSGNGFSTFNIPTYNLQTYFASLGGTQPAAARQIIFTGVF